MVKKIKKSEIKQALGNLSRLIAEGNIEKINDWFGSNNEESREVLEDALIKEYYADYHYFSFSTSGLTLSEYQKEKEKRVLAILDNLSLKGQLQLLAYMCGRGEDRDITLSQVKAIKDSGLKELSNPSLDNLCYIAFHFFAKENFELTEELVRKFGSELLTNGFSRVGFFCANEFSRAQVFLFLDGDKNKVANGLILGFSEDKKKFLEKYNVPLPNKTEVEEFEKVLFEKIEEDKRRWTTGGHVFNELTSDGKENPISKTNIKRKFEYFYSFLLADKLNKTTVLESVVSAVKKKKI